ncbi:hypothetical protein K501DRAFT_236245 [Backusella circina FSU 941]|nr:hypothetical protein K501DRAFT_236245 [Backusella circina FSU 941]
MTAKFIPNGITISTNTSKHVFASFMSRDQAYDQIVKMWNLYKRASSVQPPSFSSAEDDDSSSAQSIITNDSAVVLKNTATEPQINTTNESKNAEKINNESATTITIPNNNDIKSFVSQLKDTQRRPRAVSDSFREHYAVEPKVEPGSKRETRSQQQEQQYIVPIKKTRVCPCTIKGEQYPTIALNETYNGNTEDMFTLLFDSDLIKAFLEKFENHKDVQLGEWRHGVREVVGRRKIKSSTVVFQQTRINRKYPYYVCVTGSITTPEMPMGSVYSIKSRTCITRVNKYKVHVLVTFQVAFTKSGLISSIIEKNASDEQIRMYSKLNSVLIRPDLIREIVKDEKVLEMFKPKVIQSKRSLNWSYCVYTFFIIAAFTHCLLAIRLQRITKHLEFVQHLKNTPTESHWINHKMYTLQQKLDKLKGEVQSYDQRILNLKKSIN